jgi:hypothetical protein
MVYPNCRPKIVETRPEEDALKQKIHATLQAREREADTETQTDQHEDHKHHDHHQHHHKHKKDKDGKAEKKPKKKRKPSVSATEAVIADGALSAAMPPAVADTKPKSSDAVGALAAQSKQDEQVVKLDEPLPAAPAPAPAPQKPSVDAAPSTKPASQVGHAPQANGKEHESTPLLASRHKPDAPDGNKKRSGLFCCFTGSD